MVEYNGSHQDLTYVVRDDIQCSDGRILGYSFGFCNGIAFLDKKRKTGTLAHISSTSQPRLFFRGEGGDLGLAPVKSNEVKKLDDIYSDPDEVEVIQVFHKLGSCWNPDTIEHVLQDIGFNKPKRVEIPPFTQPKGVTYRDILLDTKKGMLWIYQRDNNKGPIQIPFFKEYS
ncbi:hypothetical protein GOV12_01410 [Candidatus Pacearchaeota archaeon]|nr:hypothetical protein [Candidatus Pacearchaeota archaeon]